MTAYLYSAFTFDCVMNMLVIQQDKCLTPSSDVEISNFAFTYQYGKFRYVPVQYGTDQWDVVNDILTDVEENENNLCICALLMKGLFNESSNAVDIFGTADCKSYELWKWKFYAMKKSVFGLRILTQQLWKAHCWWDSAYYNFIANIWSLETKFRKEILVTVHE